MPVTHDISTHPISRDEYHEIDYRVMGLAFEAHRELGRMCDEAVYQEFVRLRCAEENLTTRKEVAVIVEHEGFEKRYYLDLLVSESIIYEFKTVNSLIGTHQAQLLNYLLLTGLRHGKLVNFRPLSVEHRYVTTSLDLVARREFAVEKQDWRMVGQQCPVLLQRMVALLDDLGTFLQAELYQEALTYLMGGEDKVLQPINVVSGGHVLGNQRFHLLDETTAFRVTAVTKDIQACEMHLRRLLANTNLKAIQWINLNQHKVTFRTLTNS